MSATNNRLVAVVGVDAQPLSGYRKRQGVAGRRDAVPCRAPDAYDDFRLVHGWSLIVPDSREVYASGPALVRPNTASARQSGTAARLATPPLEDAVERGLAAPQAVHV